jgi:hypothetical protein
MKEKLIFVLLFIFIFMFNVNAQKKPTLLRSNPYKKASLYLKNGDTINGIIKLNTFNEIKFRKKEKAKKIKYNYKTVKGITIHLDSTKKYYEYKTIRDELPGGKVKIFHHLLEPIIEGKISIYLDDYEARGETRFKNIGYTSYNTEHRFYISKGNTNLVTTLGRITTKLNLYQLDSKTTIMGPNGIIKAGGKLIDFKLNYTNQVYKISDLDIKLKSKYFKKIIERYFSDCKELVSRIESGFYKQDELLSIISYYNNECVK